MVREPYPLPRLGKTIHHMEGFQYETALDINMLYYTIRIFPYIQYMMTIVTEFGNLKYNRLPMGMFTLGYIFQTKVENLLGDI